MHRLVLGAVFGFEKNEFAGAGRVQELEDNGSRETTEKSAPEDLAREVCADLDIVSFDAAIEHDDAIPLRS